MSKQDRQGARTPADLEYKYRFGKSFKEVMGIAEDAQLAAKKLDEGLTSEEIFNRLTQNGAVEGIYRDSDGQIYVNASYIQSGELIANLITAGVLKSKNGSFYLDMENGTLKMSANGNDIFAVDQNGAKISGWTANEDYFGTDQVGFVSKAFILGESANGTGAPSLIRVYAGVNDKIERKFVEFKTQIRNRSVFSLQKVDYIPSDTLNYDIHAILWNDNDIGLSEADFMQYNPLEIYKNTNTSLVMQGNLTSEAMSKYGIEPGDYLTVQVYYDSYVPAFQVLDDGSLIAEHAVLGGHNIKALIARIRSLEDKVEELEEKTKILL